MNNANKATVQKNWARLFTQFQAINGKYLEAYTTSNFTKGEKAKLFFGQLGLFGAASIPFMESSFGDFMASLGIDPLSADEDFLVGARKGFVGWLFQQGFDVKADVTGRVAFANEFLEGMIGAITEPQDLPKLFFGPSWTTLDKSMSVLQHLAAATNATISADDVTEADMLFAAEAVAESAAALPSSLNNLVKTYYVHNTNMFRTKTGKPILFENINLQTKVFMALGFQPEVLQDHYDLKQMEKARSVSISKASDMILSMYAKIADGDQKNHKAYEFAVRSVLSSFDNPSDRIAIMDALGRKIKLESSAEGTRVKKALQSIESEFSGAGAAYLSTVQEYINRGGE
jgi:hypothetical protein